MSEVFFFSPLEKNINEVNVNPIIIKIYFISWHDN